MTTSKDKVVGAILKLTKKTDKPEYFDKLIDKDAKYLERLLVVCKNFKKTK